jgi:hypothetical protein
MAWFVVRQRKPAQLAQDMRARQVLRVEGVAAYDFAWARNQRGSRAAPGAYTVEVGGVIFPISHTLWQNMQLAGRHFAVYYLPYSGEPVSVEVLDSEGVAVAHKEKRGWSLGDDGEIVYEDERVPTAEKGARR